MRRVTGYDNGRPIWSDNVPASPGSMPIRGSLVVGGPVPNGRKLDKFLAAMRETPDNGGASQPSPEVSPVSLQP